MFYSDDIIEEVRSRNDIVDIISPYVSLKKKGDNYFGLCPFHQEKSGSFCVSRSKQMYHCFGCGVGGNVYTFLMEYEKMSFSESIVQLAKRVGVTLPERELSEEEKANLDIKTRLLEINKEAAKFFFYQLKSKSGEYGRKYFEKRGLSEDTIVHFGLGYSPIDGKSLYRYLKSKGYDDDILSKSGLIIYGDKGTYDRFRDRVMFPILDVNNKVIGFGGRIMGDGEPKYLNSPETPVFDKGRNLYGLNFAKSSREDHIILCEGYMDVIALHQAGFTQAVAALGTAFTGGHANLLKRYFKNVNMTFDSDGAGVKAALRALPILKNAGLNVKSINMKPYKDPDEFIKNLGKDAFKERIANAINGFMYKADKLADEYNLKDPGEKTTFIREIAKELTDFSEEVERNNYISAISEKYEVDYKTLKDYVNKLGNDKELLEQFDGEKVRDKKNDKLVGGIAKSQQILLTMLCAEPTIYPAIKKYIEITDFIDVTYNKLAGLVFKSLEETGNIIPGQIMNMFENEEEHKLVANLFSANINEELNIKDKEKMLSDVIFNIKQDSIIYRSKNFANMTKEDKKKFIEDKAHLQKIHINLK